MSVQAQLPGIFVHLALEQFLAYAARFPGRGSAAESKLGFAGQEMEQNHVLRLAPFHFLPDLVGESLQIVSRGQRRCAVHRIDTRRGQADLLDIELGKA